MILCQVASPSPLFPFLSLPAHRSYLLLVAAACCLPACTPLCGIHRARQIVALLFLKLIKATRWGGGERKNLPGRSLQASVYVLLGGFYTLQYIKKYIYFRCVRTSFLVQLIFRRMGCNQFSCTEKYPFFFLLSARF